MTVIIGAVVAPAVLFAIAYYPLLTRLSRSLASPYAKANVTRRFYAASIDALILVSGALVARNSDPTALVVVTAVYVLLRDAMNGRSIGKFLLGLVVIDLETGRPASFPASIRRNLVFALPGADIVAIFLETRTLIHDRQGQRLGDRLAQTQVVEGYGAKDLLKDVQELLMHAGDTIGSESGRRGRAPVRTDRAA